MLARCKKCSFVVQDPDVTYAPNPALFDIWHLASSCLFELHSRTDTSFIDHALKTPQKSSQKFWIPFLHSSSLIFFFSFVSTLLLVLLQDIDVAYATDPAIFDDFEADLTSLLEVPDLDFSSSQDFPRATYRDSAFASTSAAAGKHLISTAGCMASFHVITAFHLTGNSQV